MNKILVVTVTALALLCPGAIAAASQFEKAAAMYLDGSYEQSVSALKELALKDPNNAMIHYYLGLCQMRLHERDKAGIEFEWIDEHTKDQALKAIAQAWLGRLERHSKHISDNYSIARPVVDPKHEPVAKVYWFFTNWCPKCKRFKSIFEETKPLFKNLSFGKFNSEAPENWSLVSKYKVKSYPTLVYFDKNGKVIENYAAAPLADTFRIHLQELGAKISN